MRHISSKKLKKKMEVYIEHNLKFLGECTTANMRHVKMDYRLVS